MGAHCPEKSISCAKARAGAVESASVTMKAALYLFMARKHTARLSRRPVRTYTPGTFLASIGHRADVDGPVEVDTSHHGAHGERRDCGGVEPAPHRDVGH